MSIVREKTRAVPASGKDARPGELAVPLPASSDATLYFIGRIATPWPARTDCPRTGDIEAGPLCRVEIFDLWAEALAGIDRHERLQLLYWMHHARRDLVSQSPKHDGNTQGTFGLRSPVRPNPIGSSVVRFIERQGTTLIVRGLDCVDGTPLVDVKPEFC